MFKFVVCLLLYLLTALRTYLIFSTIVYKIAKTRNIYCIHFTVILFVISYTALIFYVLVIFVYFYAAWNIAMFAHHIL